MANSVTLSKLGCDDCLSYAPADGESMAKLGHDFLPYVPADGEHADT